MKKPRKVTRVGQKNCDKLSSMNVFINSLWLAKSWSSKDVHILLPGTYEYGTWKRDFMDGLSEGSYGREIILNYLSRPREITRSLWGGSRMVRRKESSCENEDRLEWYTLRVEEGAMSQETKKQPLRARKGKETESPLEPPAGTPLCQLLDFCPGRPISDFWPPVCLIDYNTINLCCFNSLNLWWFVTAVTENWHIVWGQMVSLFISESPVCCLRLCWLCSSS